MRNDHFNEIRLNLEKWIVKDEQYIKHRKTITTFVEASSNLVTSLDEQLTTLEMDIERGNRREDLQEQINRMMVDVNLISECLQLIGVQSNNFANRGERIAHRVAHMASDVDTV